MLSVPGQLMAAVDDKAALAKIQLEKKKLDSIREKLESRLGSLGKELRRLDQALVRARAARRQVDKSIAATDQKLAQLRAEKKQLQADIGRLEERMIRQAIAAYQRASREPGWMDVFAGVEISEIPHRKKMLKFAMLRQDEERQLWNDKIAELAEVEQQEVAKRSELVALKKEKRKREREVARRVDEKRKLASRVKRDVDLNREKSKQLAEQEKALKRLIEGISAGLLGSDKSAAPLSVRKKKGRLPWPVRGKVVASFGSRPEAGRTRLAGVQLAPRTRSRAGRKVKAIAAGQVRYADWFGGYGLMMIVDHGDGLISVYAHNDALYWQMGDWVEADEIVAEAGSTGWVENIRLYFEVRDKGKAVNPKLWCRR